MNTDDQFNAAIRAFASFYNRRPKLTPEQIEGQRIAAHKKDPKHIKALAKRRKAKRGGPR